jgi:hypothetical protein
MQPPLSKLEREIAAALRGLTEGQTQLRLSPDAWSIQQTIEHLQLTYNSSVKSFAGRLAKGNPTRSRPTSQQRLVKFVVVTLGLMPGRHTAPPEVTPAASPQALSGDSLAHSVAASLEQLDGIIAQADHSFGALPCMTHFALGPLSASQWRRFHLCHGRHHIRQILAIRQAHHL